MSRFKKLLGAVALLGISLAACEEPTPPPPVGTIAGTVSIEGTGIDGVSVNLSNGNSTTTSGGGSYRFDNVEGGAYTVTISGFPSDATFDATSAAATISTAGQSVTLNFSGSYIRTASVMGTVTVENTGLGGVTVALSGVSSATATTDDTGQYAFTGLRMGNYSVEISGFDNDEVGFSSTAAAVTVGTGESKIVSFDGTYLRTAGIMGQVSVDGAGVEGVNVSLSGGPDNVGETTTTDASGQYSFAKLRAGGYAVGISGYDTDEYEFEVTSQNVAVALGETANVPFTGVLLRTSGVSGRVSVEGMGLEGITVTLSGADMDDRTAMTDAGGTYAFSGLAAGDYTVSIAVEGDAYVFDEMSMDVTVGDDQTAIVNFEGAHATTASISGMFFVDEATKNDTYDEGEDGFPAAGVPVVLVGPGVNDQMPSATNEMGQFAFTGLKAGAYQLVVAITPEVAMALGDYAYGGPATGYAFDLGVGEAATQAVPFDITHQTVNFSVWLKHGDETGDALPGATVKLYADQAGNSQVGTGMTAGEMAVTSIRFPRAGTMGNTVFAGITAPDGDYEVVADGKQAVMWDPKSPTGEVVTNTADIVNLKADLTFSGKTITTAAGGGKPLEEWAINVTMMDDDGEMVAVEGAPEMLGEDDGMAAFMSTAESAADLPMTYYFGIVGDEDQDDDFDGGEKFDVMPMPSDDAMADGAMLAYEHDGLSLAGKMDLGTLEVKYTTQTLVVWTHQEKDQVAGYTKTLSGGDSRPRARVETASGHPQRWRDVGIEFELRHIDANGRSRPVPDYENRIQHPRGRSGYSYDGNAVYTNVPADLNIVVKASTDADRRIINDDEAQAWRDFEANKVIGGAFGEHGGIHHTVSLCPETADDPDQDFLTACSTFAYVWTRDISGDAMSQSVAMAENPLAGFDIETTYHSGIQVSLNPVARKNVQADNFGATTRAEASAAGRQLGTYDIANVGDGNYELSASSGWWDATNRSGGLSYRTDEAGTVPPSPVTIDLVPRRFDVYGTVTDTDGVGLQDAEVTVGGHTVVTDDYGRYILADATPGSNRLITAAKAGHKVQTVNGDTLTTDAKKKGYSRKFTHWPNTPRMVNFSLSRVTPTGTVSGTITHLQSDEPLERVRVYALKLAAAAPADLSVPGLVNADFDFADVDTTGADGMFSVDAPAGALSGKTTTIVAYLDGMFFLPDRLITTVVDGGAYTLSFDGLRLSAIDGYVVDGDGNGMSGVTVTATGGTTGGSAGVTRSDTTLTGGRYNLRVPWGPYTVTPTKAGYSFEPRPTLSVTLAAEEVRRLENFTAKMVGSSDAVLDGLSLDPGTLSPGFSSGRLNYTANVANDVSRTTVTAIASNATVEIITPADADPVAPWHQVDLDVGETDIVVTVLAQDGITTQDYTVTVTRESSSDAALDSLSLSGEDGVELTLDPPFDPATMAYDVSVAELDETTVAAMPRNDGAEVLITPVDADDATDGHQVALRRGETTITVTVTAVDRNRQAYTVTVTNNSRATGDVTITGTAKVGETLTADASGVTDADGMENAELMYQWISVAASDDADDTDIDGATAETYDPVADDVGNMLKVRVSFTDDRGNEEEVISDATAAVAAADNNPATGDVTITGTAKVGETLTADASGVEDADGMENAELMYQWISVAASDDADDTDIDGATAETYDPVADDVGNMLTVRVSFTDDLGNTEAVMSSDTTAAVAAVSAAIVIKDEDGNVIDATIDLTEGDTVTYTVELSRAPTHEVTVAIGGTDADGTTAFTDDLLTNANTNGGAGHITLSTVTRVFTTRNWNSPQDVKIIADEDETFADHDGIELTHEATSEDDDYDGEDADIEVDISDDDVDGAAVTITDAETNGTALATLAIEENDDDGGSYWVVLAAEPKGDLGDVIVSIAAGDDDDNVEVSPTSLTFSDDDWDEAQKVTVTAPDDDVDEADKTATLTHTAKGGGYDDATLTDNVVEVTVSDDDADVAGVIVNGLAGEVLEGDSVEYSVKLASEPPATVVINVTSATPGYEAAAAAQFTFTPDNWDDLQKDTIAVPNDADDNTDDDEVVFAFAVIGYEDGTETAVTQGNQTLTVKDDDAAGVVVSHTALTIEAGETQSYTLRLTLKPAAGEKVKITITSTGQIGIDPLTVEFDANSWDDEVTVDLSPLAQASGSIEVTNTAAASTGGTTAAAKYRPVVDVSNVAVTVPSS